jgi:NAD+ diphosphatase
MYSLLAGFVEPGETIEAAVRREVLEESAVEVGAVRYLACQPWPFPTTLMIGCQGHALTTAITIDPHELEDAFWVSRSEVEAALRGEASWRAARKGSIARVILEHWVAGALTEFGT